MTDWQSLIADLPANTALLELDPLRDGLTQIADAITAYSNLDSIQIFSHGSVGSLQLGSVTLTSENITEYTQQLTTIGNALNENGDLLLYGCNVAQGAIGSTFVDQIATLTRADVAASTDLTGNSALGGDWNLEFNTGDINTKNLDLLASYQHTLTPGAVAGMPSTTEIIDVGGFNGSAFEIFGYYSAFADLSKAAYHLAPEEQLHTDQGAYINDAIVHGQGENYIKPYADEAWARVDASWTILKNTDLGIATEGSADFFGFDKWYLESDGVYHCENAAAFAVKSGDSLVISFRGTNDNDGSLWNTFGSSDAANWAVMSGYYNELQVFIDTIDDYAKNNNIKNVYVTGHSLGGGIALGYMDKHPVNSNTTADGSVINYEAVTFAAPGYLIGGVVLPPLDPRIVSIEIDGDPVPDARYHQGYMVSADVAGLIHQEEGADKGNAYSGTDYHSMDLYGQVAKAFDSELPLTYGSKSDTGTIHGFRPDMFVSKGNFLEVSIIGQESISSIDPYYTWKNEQAPKFALMAGDDRLAQTSNMWSTKYFLGGAGADTIGDFGFGIASVMIGGTGDDIYYIDNVGDQIIEGFSVDWESVYSTVSCTLSDNVEALTLTGTKAINAKGNADYNYLIGNNAANVLDGLAGVDTMQGGLGNDTYGVDDTNDVIIEYASQGWDTVWSNTDYTLTDNLEALWFYDTIISINGYGNFNGYGNALSNYMVGNNRNNILNGQDGADTMLGGLGNDSYYINNVGDVVTETSILVTEIDTVNSTISYTLRANLENLTLLGTAAINGTGNALRNILIGNDVTNTLNGGTGADTLIGGLGNDIYRVDNSGDVVTETSSLLTEIDQVNSSISYTLGANLENLSLVGIGIINGTGNVLDNVLTGNAVANRLDGGVGADTLIGGFGNDVYLIDDVGDVATENTAAGVDTVSSLISYALVANLENLTLTGTAAIDGTGNALGNVLIGNDAVNTLNGGRGADRLIGGLGNDVYVVDNVGDVVSETSTLVTEIDRVDSLVNYTLGANLENLTLTGTAAINGAGNGLNNQLLGNNANNILSGGAGADTLDGQGGADVLIGGLGQDNYILTETIAATDIVRIATGDSLIGSYDKATGFALGTGVGSAGVDKLDLVSTVIAANVASVNGVDAGIIHSHSISGGIISFDDVDNYTTPLTITTANLVNVFGYLQANIKGSNTVAFVAEGNTFVFQDGGVNPDTVVELLGVTASSVSTTGLVAGSVWVV